MSLKIVKKIQRCWETKSVVIPKSYDALELRREDWQALWRCVHFTTCHFLIPFAKEQMDKVPDDFPLKATAKSLVFEIEGYYPIESLYFWDELNGWTRQKYNAPPKDKVGSPVWVVRRSENNWIFICDIGAALHYADKTTKC